MSLKYGWNNAEKKGDKRREAGGEDQSEFFSEDIRVVGTILFIVG